MDDKPAKKKYSNEIKSLFEAINSFTEHEQIANSASKLLTTNQAHPISKFWKNELFTISYWIVLINGINSENETKLLKEFLFWQEFVAQDLAEVKFLQSVDKLNFIDCLRRFKVEKCPAVIISNQKTFENFLLLDYNVLSSKINAGKELIEFVDTIHNSLCIGDDLDFIKDNLFTATSLFSSESLQEIKKLLRKNQIEPSINRLLEIPEVSSDDSFYNEFITISNNYYSLQEKIRLGQISIEVADISRNRLVVGILKFIDQLKAEVK